MSPNTVNNALTHNVLTHTPLTLVARDDAGDIIGSPADTLRAAAGYLTTYGWHQGDLYADLTVPYPAADVTGAIRAVIYGHPTTDPVLDGRLGWHVDIALATLADTFTYPEADLRDDLTLLGWLDYAGHAVSTWNDDHNQTSDKVIIHLLITADQYDNHGRTQRRRYQR